MIIVGLFSPEEAKEVRFIADMYMFRERIIHLSRLGRMRTIAEEIGGKKCL